VTLGNMKKIIMLAIPAFALAVLSPQIAQAQGTLYVSSLGLTSSGSASVGSDSWLAADFATGTNAGGYLLNSVQLALADASGNPSGFTAMLYTAIVGRAVAVGSSLGTLNGSLNPVAGGIYTYSPSSNLLLPPNTVYFIVLTAGTAVANGPYEWSFTSTYPPVSSGGWHGGDAFLFSSDGLLWQGTAGSYAQFGINASAVPEPSTLGLLALGGFFLFWHRRKAKAV
jgi:hypothetical protein